MNKIGKTFVIIPLAVVGIVSPQIASADNLFKPSGWDNLSSDRKADDVGDILTVVIYQNAEARNIAQNVRDKDTRLDGQISGGSLSETGSLEFGSRFEGRGEVRRSDTFVTQISTKIIDKLPNGNLIIEGIQDMLINGETTEVRVQGEIRPEDISSGNQILSSHIFNAKINYDGSGFVNKSTKPGLLNKIFNMLGL